MKKIKPKRIAFDLDDTLLVSIEGFPVEPAKHQWLFRLFKSEALRLGTSELFEYCRQNGWEIWIYTSSYRDKSYIKRIFRNYGITLDGVVNQQIHNKIVQKSVSKYPPAFDISVLVDNSEGVKMEGEKYGFEVIWLPPSDLNWIGTVQEYLRNR